MTFEKLREEMKTVWNTWCEDARSACSSRDVDDMRGRLDDYLDNSDTLPDSLRVKVDNIVKDLKRFIEKEV